MESYAVDGTRMFETEISNDSVFITLALDAQRQVALENGLPPQDPLTHQLTIINNY